jgi:2-oxoglutarate ferredoxin oxidoreductase subunit delta
VGYESRPAKRGESMSLKIETKRCKGCGICVTFCPKEVLKVNEIEKVEILDESKCIHCKQCELRCPDYAIFVEK